MLFPPHFYMWTTEVLPIAMNHCCYMPSSDTHETHLAPRFKGFIHGFQPTSAYMTIN